MPSMDGEAAFVEFARAVEPALRVALVAAHGVDRGREAANDALVYARKHWDRVQGLDNPAGPLQAPIPPNPEPPARCRRSV
jgi:hypothetical protein